MITPEVTEVIGNDISKLMQPGVEKRQGMRGFDPDYVDIVDYIVRCTHKIWEEKQVGLIYTHYGHNALVHGTRGDTYGIESVVAGTVQTLAMFPDRRLFADDVIWSGDDEAGYYTSHRITSTAHHSGFGVYGVPTGRKLRYRVIADCVVKENRIVEEWLVRDELSIARQLGLDEAELVKAIAEGWAVLRGPESEVQGAVERSKGQLPPEPLLPSTAEGFDIEDFVRRAWHYIWNRRMFSEITRLYAPTFECHSASGASCTARATPCSSCWIGWPRSPTRACSSITSQCKGTRGRPSCGRALDPARHARGPRHLRQADRQRVRILGISHQHVRDGKFVVEWTVFDELAVMAQMHQLSE